MSRLSKKLRQDIFAEAHYTCEYCKSPQAYLWTDLEIDHIWPKTKGGRTIYENLCSVCRKCNELKWIQTEAIDPESGEMTSLYNPRLQTWSDHFKFSIDGTLILGKTAIGRATIATLQLNRERAILLRRMWMKAGWRLPKD